jgi:hypothetical protein
MSSTMTARVCVCGFDELPLTERQYLYRLLLRPAGPGLRAYIGRRLIPQHRASVGGVALSRDITIGALLPDCR